MKNNKKNKISGPGLKKPNKQFTPEKLQKQNLIIMCINIGIFSLLCLGVFVIIILPIIQWLYALAKTPLQDYFLRVWFIGIPLLVVTGIYGGVLFWPLLTKFNNIKYKGHNIDIYLGVRTIVICIDGKVSGYVTHGFYSCPKITWYIEIGDEYSTIEVVKKNQYNIELNSEPINFHKVEFESNNSVKIDKAR